MYFKLGIWVHILFLMIGFEFIIDETYNLCCLFIELIALNVDLF
jgi:hypothetical protein